MKFIATDAVGFIGVHVSKYYLKIDLRDFIE